MSHGKFGTAINCMDGRTQEPVARYVKEHYGVDYVDTITEPGPVKMMASGSGQLESIRTRLDISLKKHGSTVVAVVAHHDCAGNPVEKATQLAQIKKSIELLRAWGVKAEIIGLWVGEDWKAEKVE